MVTLSHGGYAKAQPVTAYQAQRRGGRGKAATAMKEEDFVDKLFVANTHDTLLCFSSVGKMYWLKVYQLPQASRGSRGKPIVNLLPLQEEERITAVLPIHEFEENKFVFMTTAQGTVKKTSLEAFSRPRQAGIIAIELEAGDRLVGVDITDGHRQIILCSSGGKAIRFDENDVRPMGRTAAGVRGIRLPVSEEVISLIIVDEQGMVLTASQNGYGKRTPVEDFPMHGRGGQGVIALQISERNGQMVGALLVKPDDEIMLISSSGTLVRTPVGEISIQGRNTQGVRLIRLDEGDRLVGLERIVARRGRRTAAKAKRAASVAPTESELQPPTYAFLYSSNVIPFGDEAWYTSLPFLTVTLTVRHARFQFQSRPGGSAAGSSRTGPRGAARLARHRHVRDGDEPSRQGVRLDRRSRRGGPARAAGRAEELQGAVPARRRHRAVRGRPAQPDDAGERRRLREHGLVVEEGDRRSEALRARQRRRRRGRAVRVDSSRRELEAHADAAYLHYTPNETIGGVEFHFVPDAGSVPLVADMSSTILSRPIDVAKFGVIYAGAQKNIGPAGLTLVIVREDLLGRARPATPAFMDFAAMAKDGSMLEHAADLRVVHGGARVPVAEAAGRAARHRRAQPRQGARSCTRRSTARRSIATRSRRTRARG